MDPVDAQNPAFTEMLAALVYEQLQLLVRRKDRPNLTVPGYQVGLLRHMNEAWPRRSEKFQREWIEAFRVVCVQLSDTGKTWEAGIPPSKVEGMKKIDED